MIVFRHSMSRHAIFKRSCQLLSTASPFENPIQDKHNQWEKKPWRISAAVTVERLPIVSPELKGIEKKTVELLTELENEQSLKSDHEMRHIEDREIAEMKKAGQPIPIEKMNRITAYDEEEHWNKDAATFTSGLRNTEADEKNDTKSLNRALDKSLYLLVKQNNSWTIPTLVNENNEESLRETAEKAIQKYCGKNFKAQILGNAPFVHYTNKYSKKYQEHTGARGEKVFVFKAYFQDGQVKAEQCTEDFQWLKREEVFEKVDSLLKSPLATILYDDE